MAQDYTQGDYGTLPADTTNLKNAFAAGDYTAVSAVDAVYASQGMNDMYGIQMFKDTDVNSTGTFSVSWVGNVSITGSAYPAYLAVYNFNASAWETKVSASTTDTANFTMTAEVAADGSNYHSADSNRAWRVYQSAPLSAQMQYWENFLGDGAGFYAYSNGTMSYQAVVIPLSLSFNYPVMLVSGATYGTTTSRSWNHTIQIGLYSFNADTLDLVNSASANVLKVNTASGTSWVSFATSATSNVTPGLYYLGVNVISGGGSSALFLFGNSSLNLANAGPVMVMGRATASTNDIPANIETSKLDITGSDAIGQPYIIITS